MAEEKALRRLRVSLALNALIVLLAADGVAQHFSALGWGMFRYYTLCSNAFLLLACAMCAAYQAAILGGKRLFLPSWASLLKYFAVCTVAVTLFVVVFVLAPMMGGGGMLRHLLFSRSMFAHHFACPLLGIFSLLFADDTYLTDPKLARFALAPTLLYAAVVIVLNLLRVLRGPYPFLYVYEQPVWMSIFWCVVILGLAYALAWGLRRLSLLTARREETAEPAPAQRTGGALCRRACGNGRDAPAAYSRADRDRRHARVSQKVPAGVPRGTRPGSLPRRGGALRDGRSALLGAARAAFRRVLPHGGRPGALFQRQRRGGGPDGIGSQFL